MPRMTAPTHAATMTIMTTDAAITNRHVLKMASHPPVMEQVLLRFTRFVSIHAGLTLFLTSLSVFLLSGRNVRWLRRMLPPGESR